MDALAESDLVATLVPLVEDGAVVTVIRNTVGSAQDTFMCECERLSGDRVTLLHSRFLADARAERERTSAPGWGRPARGVTRPRGFVVVGTQVLEQSLDIDADVMISDPHRSICSSSGPAGCTGTSAAPGRRTVLPPAARPVSTCWARLTSTRRPRNSSPEAGLSMARVGYCVPPQSWRRTWREPQS